MKRIGLLVSLLLLLLTVTAQAQDATFPTQPQVTVVLAATATTGNTLWFDLSSVNPPGNTTYWTLSWFSKGTVSTCSVKSQQSAVNDGTGVSDLNTSETCTSSNTTTGAATLAAGSNYVRISLGTKTGSGTTQAVLLGYRQNPYGSIATSGGGTTDVDIVANSIGLVEQHAPGSVTSGQSGALVLCATTTAAPSNTTAQSNALSCTTTGDIRAQVQGTDADGATTTGRAVRIAGKDGSGNTQDIATDTGGNLTLSPSVYNSTQPTYANGNSAPQYEISTRGELKTVTMDAAGNARGANVDASNRLTVASTPMVATSGGVTPGSWISDNSSTSTVIKNSPGQLYSLDVTNLLAAAMYVRLYNTTSATCTSATGIVGRWIVPASTTGAGSTLQIPTQGFALGTGITLCITTTVSDTNNTAIASNSAVVTYGFN